MIGNIRMTAAGNPAVGILAVTMAAMLAMSAGGCRDTYRVLPLRTVSEAVPGCRGVGFFQPVVLKAASYDANLVWLDFGDRGRREAIWPLGYRVAFGPDVPVILDSTGQIVHRAGDAISGGCTTPDENTFLIVPDLE